MKVEILIPDITRLATKTRYDENGLLTSIQFEAKINPGSIARILNLVRQGAPIMASISSPQAHMDLSVSEYAPAEEVQATQIEAFPFLEGEERSS